MCTHSSGSGLLATGPLHLPGTLTRWLALQYTPNLEYSGSKSGLRTHSSVRYDSLAPRVRGQFVIPLQVHHMGPGDQSQLISPPCPKCHLTPSLAFSWPFLQWCIWSLCDRLPLGEGQGCRVRALLLARCQFSHIWTIIVRCPGDHKVSGQALQCSLRCMLLRPACEESEG